MQGRILWVVALLASSLSAGPALTTIEDRLYQADGSKFEGVLFVQWKSFETGESINVPGSTVTARVVDGLVRIALVPTTTTTPPAYYRVHYNSNGLTDFVEYWAVPPSLSPVRVRDVRIPGPLSMSQPPVPPINTAILIPDISGLRDELDSRPIKGAGFTSGRAAVVNSEGALESALGSASDCVHVDGTSGPCGGGGGVAFVDAETPAGAVDGSNATFTLAAIPQPMLSLKLYRNGLLQRANVDYTIAGGVLTMYPVPQPGDVLASYYRTTDATAGTPRFMDNETPTGTTNGANRTFELSTAPVPAASLQLTRNGLLMRLGVDYDLAANTITFRIGAIPESADILRADYRY